LYKLGTDFNNGSSDRKIFQIDKKLNDYRQIKLEARTTGYQNYVREDLLQLEDATFINGIVAGIACAEHPDYFVKEKTVNGAQLRCRLSGDLLRFDKYWNYLPNNPDNLNSRSQYNSGLDALASQFQEDICILKVNRDSNSLVAAHLCFPNHWSITDKIGKNFLDIHEPVNGFSKSNPHSTKLLNAVLNSGPYVRFAWGLSDDEELDHHPDTVKAFQFIAGENDLYVRVERQVLLGFPERNLLVFFIRTYYEDVGALLKIEGLPRQLANALLTMDEGLLRYKGLYDQHESIVSWLKNFY